MVNFNGSIIPESQVFLGINNRAFKYGDSLFETIKTYNGHLLFWEDHYLRLMASMRIARMQIPMEFTMEYLETEIKKITAQNGHEPSARVRLSVFRVDGGVYLPQSNQVHFIVQTELLPNAFYSFSSEAYEIELFKDYYIQPGLLSSLKSNNRLLNIVASVYANENGYQNCLLLNNAKNVVEATNGNVFLVFGKTVKTPPLQEGCLNGIMRKQVVKLLKKKEGFEIVEEPVSPFELQKADEIFITNVIQGIVPVTKYRKKEYASKVSLSILEEINQKLVVEASV